MIETQKLKELLIEYKSDRVRMDRAPEKVQERYDTIIAVLEEVIERREQ